MTAAAATGNRRTRRLVPVNAPSVSGHVRESDLVALTRVRLDALRRLLSGTKPVRRARDPWYRWQDVLPLLTPNQVRHMRRQLAGQSRAHSWLAQYPQLMREWHPTRNDVQADALSHGSRRRAWWQCGKGHEWRVAICTRTAQRTGCPYCSGAPRRARTIARRAAAGAGARMAPRQERGADAAQCDRDEQPARLVALRRPS